MPAPAFVKEPVVAVEAPEMVNAEAAVLTSIVDVVSAVRVKFLFVDAVTPVYLRVPPLRIRLAAAFVACPRLPATPPSPIVATLKVPELIVVTPV